MGKPLVSVIMSVYNDASYLKEAVDSILNQSFKEFEFIIINDGSSDNSLDILQEYEKNDSRIILIEQENKGLTKSLNIAIKMASGKYIARMDSDDISSSTRLQKQVEFLENNVQYALIGCNVEKIDSNGKHIEFNETKYTDKDIRQTLKTRNCFAHGSVMINKELVGDAFMYDEDFEYAQDYKLWTQVARKFKVANLSEPLYKLRLHDKSISKEKIEQQSIYAGVIAYEFESGLSIIDIQNELEKNTKLKEKIGLILLMNQQPKLALKYFSKISKYFYIAYLLQYVNLYKFKRFIK